MTDQEPVPVDSVEETVAKLPLRRDLHSGVPETTGQQRMYAMLAHLLGIVTGPLAALVFWVVMKADPFVEKESREALNFQISVLLAVVAGYILVLVIIGTYVITAAIVLNIVFCVIAAAHAHGGEPYRYPLCIRLIKDPA